MRLNDATPQDWDRVRETGEPTFESYMERLESKYVYDSTEDYGKEVTSDAGDFADCWAEPKKGRGIDAWMKAAHKESDIEPDTVRIPAHYDMTTEEGRQEVWEMFANVNQDDEDDDEDDDDDYEDEYDAVIRPEHYNTGNIECIEAIEESMSSVAFKGYLKGNCIKYLWRYDYKGKQVEDLQKAGWYLNKLTKMVAEENS